MNTSIHVLIAGTLLTSATALAPASTYYECANGKPLRWAGDSATFRADATSFPVGGAWADALAEATDAWSGAPSAFEFVLEWNDPTVGLNNGQNEIWWSDDLDGDAIGVASWTYGGDCAFDEVDVRFLSTHAFTPSTVAAELEIYGGDSDSFQGVAIHEFGHALGLLHTAGVYSVMGLGQQHVHRHGGAARAYVGEDATSGATFLYGPVPGEFVDLAVADLRRVGEYEGYSVHGPNRLFDVADQEMPHETGDPVTYLVAKGQEVALEVTFENLGKSMQTAQVGYYLSEDDVISTADTQLDVQIVTVSPDVPSTMSSLPFSIPLTIDGDEDYWLGAIVDYYDVIDEVDETNNAMATRIHVLESTPDLLAVTVNGPSSATAGQEVNASRNVYNVGDPFAGAFLYELRLSEDPSIDSSDPFVAYLSSTKLGYEGHQVTIPVTVPSGTYHWGLVVKPVANETNTTNNTIAGGKVTITALPDVAATQISGPAAAVVGQTVTFDGLIESLGEPFAGPIAYEVRLDSDVTAGEPLVASGTLTAPGAIGQTVELPPEVVPGPYYWTLIVTPVAGEGNTWNNTAYGDLLVVSDAPDVVAASVDGPENVETGETLAIDVSITGSAGSAASIPYEIRLSEDANISGSDLLVHAGSVSSPGPFDITVTVPFDAPPGTYRWGLLVSPVPLEVDTADNAVAGGEVTLTGPAGLAAEEIVGPSSAFTGDVVTVDALITGTTGSATTTIAYEVRLSEDGIVTPSDTLVHAGTVAAAGWTTVPVALPADLPAGTYRWGLLVPPTAGDPDPSDNAVAGGPLVLTSKPDLIAKKLKGKSKVKAGKKTKLKFEIAAKDHAGPCDFEILLSPDPLINDDDPVVALGTTWTYGKQKLKFEVPIVPKGKYYFGLRLKSFPGEASTTNNVIAYGPVKVKGG